MHKEKGQKMGENTKGVRENKKGRVDENRKSGR